MYIVNTEPVAKINFYYDGALAVLSVVAFITGALLAFVSFLYVRCERVLAHHAGAPTVQVLAPPLEVVGPTVDVLAPA